VSNDIRDIESHERPQSRELILAYNDELSDALFQQQSEEVSTMLSTAGVAQARRRRLRAATIRARRMAEDIAITELDLANLGAAFLASLVGDDDDDDNRAASVNNEVDTSMNASDEAGASSAVAPFALNFPSHQSSGESSIVAVTSDVQATANPPQINGPLESDEGDLSGLYSQFRGSWAPPAPLVALFEEDDTFFSPPLRGKITAELSEISDAFESERVEQDFSLPYLNDLVAAGPADRGDSERDRTPSAGDEVHALSTVAPGAPNSPSHEITEVDLANLGAAFLAGAADDEDDASVNNEVDMRLSAGDEAGSSSVAAPFALNSPSYQSSAQSTVGTTPSDVQTTADPPKSIDALGVEGVDRSCPCSPWRDSCDSSAPLIPFPEDDTFSPLLRGELDLAAFAQNGQPTVNSADRDRVASERASYDPALQSVSIANADKHSPAGSAETDARLVQQELDTSAVDEARSSFFVAPPQPTAVWHMEPVGIVVQLTPPSPTNTIRPSQSNWLAERREMNRYNGPGLVGQQAGMLAVPSFRKRSRRRRTTESSQPEDVAACSNRRGLDLPLGLVERNTDARSRPIGFQGFSPSCPSAPNAETVPISGYPTGSFKRSSPPTSQIGGAPFRSAKTGVKLGAAGEAEPSSRVAPTRSPAVLKKSRKVKTVSSRVATHPVRHHSGSLALRITTRLRGWGTTASRFFGFRRRVRVEENRTGNPYFDPWEGFVPPRAPSPKTTPDDHLPARQSNIWNIYAKID
ncbi:hypothetical protein FRC01_008973, partial [Tulasnella sp. 417]